MKRINPATEESLPEVPDHTPAEIESRLITAAAEFSTWSRVSLDRRAALMRKAGQLLRERKSQLAMMMTTEMGKPISGAEAEIEKCAACCDHFAQHSAEYLSNQDLSTDGLRGYVRFDPLGAIYAIMPWNFPFWQVFRFAAPTLMAGNVGVLKHAGNVPECALAIEAIFRDAGFPEGAFTTLLVSDNAVAENIVRHPTIKAVTLTGSGRAGKAVAAVAGSVLKKVVLELGGSDPFIVLKDADVHAVAKMAAEARCINSGQSCIAAKRFIVDKSIASAFEKAFADELRKMKMGDPTDRSTQIGPMARKDLLEQLADQVDRSIRSGARLVVGGEQGKGEGFFYAPTLLSDVKPGIAAFDEETFGPVAALITAEDAADAAQLANASVYGLGASIWSGDAAKAEALVGQIEAGFVSVNGIVRSDPRLPFGGIKESGYGRELSSYGIHEFVNIKTVMLNK